MQMVHIIETTTLPPESILFHQMLSTHKNKKKQNLYVGPLQSL